MRIAGFLGSGLAGQDGGQRRLALHQLLQRGKDFANLVEAVQSLSPAAQLAGSLRAAQEQHADQRRLRAAEVEGLAQPVLVLGDAPVSGARAAGQLQLFQPMRAPDAPLPRPDPLPARGCER